VVISPGDWIWKQLGELLSALFEGAAHLAPTVSWLLLRALFITVLRDESSHSTSLAGFVYLSFFWMPVPFFSPVCGPTSLLQFQSLFIYSSLGEMLLPHSPAKHAACQPLLEAFPSPSMVGVVMPHLLSPSGLFIYSSLGEVPHLFSLVEPAASQPLLEAFLLASSLWGPLPLFLMQACLFRVHVGKCPHQPLLQAFPTPSSLGKAAKPAFAREFVYLQLVWGSDAPPLSRAQRAQPSATCAFQLLIIQLFFHFVLCFFAGWGSVCPGGYAGLSQGWLWEYCMPLICSPVGLYLPSSAEGLLVPLYIMAWGSCVQAGSSEVLEFWLFFVVLPARCVSIISARFLL
jgi:hypothetical protein